MNEVSKWIKSGAGVNEGLRLLSVYAPNKYLAELVTKAPERYGVLLVDRLRVFADAVADEDAGLVVDSTMTHLKPSSLREDWPFLSKPDCPMELKVLASDKITAYHNFCDLHEKLFSCTSEDECFEVAKNLLKNYRQNSLIFLEFAYYKEHGTVLGKHPIFDETKQLDTYRSMSLYKLAKEQKRLEGAIWRIKSEIRKGDKPQLLSEREERLARKQRELDAINKMISDSEK